MSQEYTPVDWVDETTSQQGTLINAARLTQMQTAHHYADGFEEVDAIPTEDPGVDYHKVVYCTADATFYRWDGTQWTADIDEETKHLLDQEIARAEHAEGLIQGYLDAHEANRNNPHQVTKAQVGLGNCDNTADTDKPISTATQAALDTKADKATTLAGYGITDAYTKSATDTLLADKADKADVYDKTAADTLLAGKVDKLVSSPAGTYKSVTVNAQGQVTAGTNPDTLAGYGITDAYTKTEADTLLAAKADTTALTDGSVTKVGTADLGTDTKPIKLVGGVPTAVTNDLVTTDTAQEITANKTFKSRATFDYYNPELTLDRGNSIGINVRLKEDTYNVAPAADKSYTQMVYDKDGVNQGQIQFFHGSSGSRVWRMGGISNTGASKAVDLVHIDNDGTAYMLGLSRAYNAANTSDVATIGTLDAYSPMVRTSGNQTVGGVKTYQAFGEIIAKASAVQFSATNAYFKLGHIGRQLNAKITLTIGGGYTAANDIIDLFFHTFNVTAHYGTWRLRRFNESTDKARLYIGTTSGVDGFDIWVKMPAILTWLVIEAHVISYGDVISNTNITGTDTNPTADPSASYSSFTEVPQI